ncbi:unnamed protein product [Mesocestoides corti]|nr:unnamed protein product [Mesocestoides corti]
MSGRFRGSGNGEDHQNRFTSHRGSSSHSIGTLTPEGEKESGRSLSANYSLRPLPPPPPPRYHFGCLLRNGLPPMPPGLMAKCNTSGSRGTQFGIVNLTSSAGDVKVILCVKMPLTLSNDVGKPEGASSLNSITTMGASSNPCVSIAPRRKQVTLIHPSPSRRRFSLTAPKMFTFDAVFTQDDPLAEVCSAALTDAVYSVVHGTDSCVLSFGHAKTGKTRTMLGSDASVVTAGVIPCAIAWLFRLVEEQKAKSKTRFSIRVSAVEVFGQDEAFKDLLQESAAYGDEDHLPVPAPSSCLRDFSPTRHAKPLASPSNDNSPAARLSLAMDKLTEIRSPTADHAAHLLDVALANRAQNVSISHTLFTLHVYQYKVEKNGAETEVSGGRSRLQLLHLGCGRYSSKEPGQNYDQASTPTTMKSLSLSNMANVLLGLLTGQRHLPHRESAVTQLLREGMTGNHAQPCIIAHASGQQQHYSETLQIVQLASRLHRLRRRRVGSSGGSNVGGSSSTTVVGSTTSDSSASGRSIRSRMSMRPRLGRSSFGTSTTDYTSSSEQSCAGDTVIYLGVGGASETESPLEPRGLADGGVVHSADEWKMYASSGEEGTFERSAVSGKTRIGRSLSQSDGGGTLRPGFLIKRVTPRTNATAWPRAAAVRKGKEVVSSTEETWVDGPNAVVATEQRNNTSESVPPPAPPYFGFTHHIVPQNSVQNSETVRIFVAPTDITDEVQIKEPTYATIDETKGRGNSGGKSSSSESCSSSDDDDGREEVKRISVSSHSDTGRGGVSSGSSGGGGGSGGGGRGFGVLSDISERTEETEGGTSAPSSIVGGAQEDHENTLLDLAIQQSGLVSEEGTKTCDEGNFGWHLTDAILEAPKLSFMRPSYAVPQHAPASTGHGVASPIPTDDQPTPMHQSGSPTMPTAQRIEKATSTDHPTSEQMTSKTSTCCSERLNASNRSPRRRKRSNTSSFDRVAAWVKDVSTDLGHVRDEERLLPPESRSSSCHRSFCSRRHQVHRKRRHRRSNHHEISCSKCSKSRGVCALCEVADKCCSRTCKKCGYCEAERLSDGMQISELPSHEPPRSDTSKNEIKTAEVSTKSQNRIPKAASLSPVPLAPQRTVSFPWMPAQFSQLSTAHSSPCQLPAPPRPFWSSLYAPPHPTPMQYYPWSLPTSPFLHSSMQAWSSQLPLPSSAASDLSRTIPLSPQPHALRRSDSADTGTPVHTSSSSASAIPQEAKKSKFFTLPSIICTLRRWHARRKERRSKKASDSAVQKEEAVKTPLRINASLPGTYAQSGFPRAPSSDQGIGAPKYSQYQRMAPPPHHPLLQPAPSICSTNASSFMNRMHQSLSTYRTSSRSGPNGQKDSRGDRGSSGYESARQGAPGGGGSEVSSSAHTDSIDSCSSGCQQHQLKPHPTYPSAGQRFFPSCHPTAPLIGGVLQAPSQFVQR